MPDSIGNTLSDATNIIIGSTTRRFSDSVEFGDNDFFRFTLNSVSGFNLSLSGLSANAEVDLLNSAGNLVTVNSVPLQSVNEGTLTESINTILQPGTYYVRVRPGAPIDPTNPSGSTPSTNYNLDIAADNGTSIDIVWRYYVEGNGANAIWRLDGTNFLSVELLDPIRTTLWQIAGLGDFNADGQSDLLWRYYGEGGLNSTWLLNGTTAGSYVLLDSEPDLNWEIHGAADFNGDNRPDIVWHNPTTAQTRIWFLNDTGNTIGVSPLTFPDGSPAGYPSPARLQAVGDFNRDNRPDLIWRNGEINVVWFMNGTTVQEIQSIPIEPDLNKQIGGAGDFNGDGSADLLWRNYATGENEIWLFELNSRTSIVPLPAVPGPGWVPLAPFRRVDPVTLFDIGSSARTSAFEIGTLNGSGIYRDEITAIDTEDYYQFSLGSRTRLNLALDGIGSNALLGNLNVEIINGSGTVVSQSSNPGTSPEAIANLDLDAGTYFVRVFAGQTGATSAYDLNLSVNNLPTLVSSGPVTINEGQSQTLSSSLLSVRDDNDPPPRLTYNLVATPTNGSLLLGGAALATSNTFTQADINQGRLAYQHNGGETTLDSFVFGVSDGRGGTIPNTTFSISVTPVNDLPVLRSLNPITVTEGLSTTISNTSLLVTDIEQPPGQIIYTLSTLPSLGTLSLNVGANAGPLTTGNTFTQADINSGRLTFQQNGTEAEPSGRDTFTFVATDGAGGFLNPQTQTLTINVQPVNDAPVLVTNTALTVSQSGFSTISSTLLRATDAELTSPAQQDQIRYSVTQLPTQGNLVLNTIAQTTLFAFSQADINAGALQYSQNGGPVNSDRFNFRLSDGVNTVPGAGDFSFDIFVQRVPGPPGLATTNPSLTLTEGGAEVITNSRLRVTDPDSAAQLITLTLGATPTSGTLLRLGTALTTGQTFTQADIDSGRIEYRHNGNEQPATDTFTFTFRDERGTGPAAPTTFSLSITPVNDLPTIVTPIVQLTVTEGLSVDLTPSLLQVTDPDNQPRDIVYTTTSPNNGSLFRFGTAVTTFTQADLAGGQIRYIQNGSEAVSDSFTFTVADLSNTPVGPGTVNLTVIPFNDAPGIQNLTSISLGEGGTELIGSANLTITDEDGPGPLTYTIGTLPGNGILRRGNVTLSTGGTFTQADVSNGQLFYVHSGNETTSDRFTFTASDGAVSGLGAPGLIGERTFSITVGSINDLPEISLNTGLTLSEGAVGVINTARLRTTDPDNITSQLTYNVSSGPSSGTLLSSGVAVTSFTQAQLDGNLITYRHNGGETTVDDFIFEVTDGQGSTGPRTFNISITPVNDIPTVVVNAGLPLNEGASAVISEAELLLTDPDGPNPTVIFTLGAAPSRGALVRDGVTLSNGQTFTQADIAGGLLSYINNGADPVANDRFTFTASDGSPTGTLSLRTFSLTVSPINDAPIISAPTSISASEDQTFTFRGNTAISVVDPDGGPTFAATITSSTGGTINLGTTSGLSGLTGNGSNSVSFNAPLGSLNAALNNLRYRGVQDFSGTEEIVVSIDDGNGGVESRTITVNVAAVNDAPTLTLPTTSITILEDQPSSPLVLTVADVDADITPLLVTLAVSNGSITVNDPGTLTFVNNTSNGSGTVSFTGLIADIQAALAGVVYQGNSNYFGNDRINITVNDQGSGTPNAQSVSRSINVSVTPVNDRPTFTVTGSSVINVNEDSPQQRLPFASGIFTGAANETQSLSFSIAPSSTADATLLPSLFTATPTISATSGNLTFTPRANANGTVALVAFLVDNGGTANGGVNTSEPFTFSIEVNQVNDAPSFTRGGNQITNEDSGPVTINNWVTNVSVGPSTAAANESTQTPTFIFETNNPSLFSAGPEIVNLTGTTGALTYTPAPDANGTAIVTVRLQDDGGTDNGGINTSPPQSFTITVRSVNDAPTFNSTVTTIDVLEDDPQQTVQFATDIVVGPSNELSQTATFTISANSNPNLFLASGGGIAPTISPNGVLTFRTAANASGSAVLTARLVDNGGTANGGVNSSVPYVFTINATAVNDAPTFITGRNQTVNEDSPAQTVTNWATNILAGPPNESTQTRTFVVDNNNPNLFTSVGQPTISSTGTLTYTPAPNAFGSAIVTVSLVDNGGTDNGGVDTSAVQTFTITVNAVNDAPTLTLPGIQTTQEDTPINFSDAIAIALTDIDSGSNPIELRLSVNNGTILLPSTNGLTVDSGANGTRTVTFRGTVEDLITALASVVYTPNTAFNGSDALTVVVNDRGFFGSGGARTTSGTVPITVTSVNDAPVLAVLSSLILQENENRSINNTLLRTTDVDNSAAQITYTLADTPDFGSLRLSAGAGFTTLATGAFFTQADIDAGRLNYIQNGSESTTDSFSFRVSDGQIVVSPDSTFNITIIPVNDPPGQSINTALVVSEAEAGTISNTLLQFTDNDNTPNEISYTITSAPSSGTLRLGGTDLTINSTFTQEQINNGLLVYEQNGSETVADSFNFRVAGSIDNFAFNITVVPVNDAPVLVSRGPLAVNEGASIPVRNTVLQTTDSDTPTSQIIYTLTGGPQFGVLLRSGATTLASGATFTQAEIDSGAVSYRHNGSENSTDAFFFNVSDGGSPIQGILNINVNPFNDPPVVVRSTGLTLPAGTATTRPINNSQLRATDADNTATDQVFFELISPPNASVGSLRLNATALSAGGRFSQRDVDQGRISYQYLGSGNSDGFQFRVVDAGGAIGETRFFNISFTA